MPITKPEKKNKTPMVVFYSFSFFQPALLSVQSFHQDYQQRESKKQFKRMNEKNNYNVVLLNLQKFIQINFFRSVLRWSPQEMNRKRANGEKSRRFAFCVAMFESILFYFDIADVCVFVFLYYMVFSLFELACHEMKLCACIMVQFSLA